MTKKRKADDAALEPLEPVKLFGAELDIQTPDDLPPFVFLAVQEVFAQLGELPNFVLAAMMGAALTHHPKVKKTVQNYEAAKKLSQEEQAEIMTAGAALMTIFSRRLQKDLAEAAEAVEAAEDEEGDTPNDGSTPENGDETSSAEPTPA